MINNKTKLFSIALFSIVVTLGCSSGKQDTATEIETDGVLPNYFFDLKGYFEKEKERLKAAETRIVKTVTLNEQREEAVFDSLNFSRDFSVFIDSDINKRSWLDKYEVDTLRDGNRQVVKYEAKDRQLRTKLLTVVFSQGQVASIHVENSSKTYISQSTQVLDYAPDTGFSIENYQKLLLGKDRNLSIDVKFR